MKKNMKFIVGITAIVSAIIYLGITGFNSDLSYYKTVEEVVAMGNDVMNVKLKVAGNVVEGSIDRTKEPLTFKIYQNDTEIPVRYISKNPVPDTFVDGCETVVSGKFAENGVFEANHIQAKCASKYESELQEATGLN